MVMIWQFVFSYSIFAAAGANVIQIRSDNHQQIISGHELVFINFYADWCRFSQMLTPIFEEAANKVKEAFPREGKVAMAKVDCDAEGGVAAEYHVSKYPTLKIVRDGQQLKKEYRGQRTADAIKDFIVKQLENALVRVQALSELDNLPRNKRIIIGYFAADDSEDYRLFQKLAGVLRDECMFYAGVGSISESERANGDRVIFREPNTSGHSDEAYVGLLSDYDTLKIWAHDKCVPLVREITFENAEDLTEEGLPFMILFHDPNDKETPAAFRRQVATELIQEKSSVNFLVADGHKFSHPLHHLGKSTSDLPVLAIDSFRHMYLWKEDPRTDLNKSGLIKMFIDDLHSGKLHREFHHGPDHAANGDKAVAVANQQQLNVQHQMIMHDNGVQVRVIKLNGISSNGNGVINLGDIIKQMMEGPNSFENLPAKNEKVDKVIVNNEEQKPDDEGKRNAAEGADGMQSASIPPVVHLDEKEAQKQNANQVLQWEDKVMVKEKSLKSPTEKAATTKSPPQSIFRKLMPSDTRYTLLKEEL